MTREEVLHTDFGKNCFHRLGVWQKEFHNNDTILSYPDEALTDTSDLIWMIYTVPAGLDPARPETVGDVCGTIFTTDREGNEDLMFHCYSSTHCCGVISGDKLYAFNERGCNELPWSDFADPEVRKQHKITLFRFEEKHDAS